MKDKNWFGTGGEAKFFAEPETVGEFRDALVYAKANNLETFVIGDGANLLVHDEGFDGVVIRPRMNDVTFEQVGDDGWHVSIRKDPAQEYIRLYAANGEITDEEMALAHRIAAVDELLDTLQVIFNRVMYESPMNEIENIFDGEMIARVRGVLNKAEGKS